VNYGASPVDCENYQRYLVELRSLTYSSGFSHIAHSHASVIVTIIFLPMAIPSLHRTLPCRTCGFTILHALLLSSITPQTTPLTHPISRSAFTRGNATSLPVVVWITKCAFGMPRPQNASKSSTSVSTLPRTLLLGLFCLLMMLVCRSASIHSSRKCWSAAASITWSGFGIRGLVFAMFPMISVSMNLWFSCHARLWSRMVA
jgi:hypothetical protein